MFTDLNVFKMAHAMATHAGTRQAVISQNMANADTPGYKAQDIASFASTYSGDMSVSQMRTTRNSHLTSADSGKSWSAFETNAATDPNGNSVSVEEEMLKAVDTKRQHDRALAIYRSSLTILRTSLGRT